MDHMYQFGAPQMSEHETHHHWNYMQAEVPYRPYHHSAAVRCPATGNVFRPRNTGPPERGNYPSAWIPPARLHGHSSSSHAAPRNSFETSGPLHTWHQLSTSKNYPHHASSSNYVVERNCLDPSMSNQRYPCKRKSPAIPPISERSSKSGPYSRGVSSDAYFSSDSQQEGSIVNVHHNRLEPKNLTPTFRSHGLAGEGESSTRNVRSRYTLQSECDAFGNNQSGNNPHRTNLTRHPLDHPINHQHGVSPAPFSVWKPELLPTFPRAMATLPDARCWSHEPAQFFNGNRFSNDSGRAGSYHHSSTEGRTFSVRQHSAATMAHSTTGILSSHVHRSNRNTGTGIPHASGGAGWQFCHRGGGPRFSGERHQSHSVDAVGYDLLTPEAIMIPDYATFYESMNLIDHHRGMRLDIDNMSYEELLELSERIGSVNTGVPDHLLLKCLTAKQYFSSNPVSAETCSICLEEYQGTDKLVTMNACGHDYHEHCIKRWLSMKYSCPICKVAALPD